LLENLDLIIYYIKFNTSNTHTMEDIGLFTEKEIYIACTWFLILGLGCGFILGLRSKESSQKEVSEDEE